MRMESPNLAALTIMIEYAAIEAGLLKKKPLEKLLLAALKEARRALASEEESQSRVQKTN